MYKKVIFGSLILVGMMGLAIGFYNLSCFAQGGETITITTYYPAPFGVYKELRAKRMAIGDNYYDASGYAWGVDIDSNADLVVEGKVGIGMTKPGSYKLYVNGTAYATGGWQPSDKRLKNIISGIEDPVERLKKLKGVKFEWKTDEYSEKGLPEGTHYGLIAQEVEKVFPEVIREDNEGYKALSYSELIPVLIEAIKEQEKRIEALEAKLNIGQ